ncbi:MAG: extracellular solute-binding protein, partial [Lachnospiraceae bacterium]|nr:extracellular solute-binding protein [Lachnospiraceae bacterium]
MKHRYFKRIFAVALAAGMLVSLTACGGKSSVKLNNGEFQEVDKSELEFPLKEKTTLTGMTSYPANTESDPNKRTIFKRLQEKTNVEIKWTAIQSDQWADKISLNMANPDLLTDFIFSAGFSDNDLLKYADQGIIIPLEEYIDAYMPNLSAVFEK